MHSFQFHKYFVTCCTLHFSFFFRVDVNLRRTVYCNAIRNGGIDEWDFAYQKYKTSNVATEKAVLLSALSCSRDVWVLSR